MTDPDPDASDSSLEAQRLIELWERTVGSEADLSAVSLDASYLPLWAARSLPAEPPVRDFERGALLGKGGMGEVYSARQLALDREVALKQLRPERRGSGAARERFLAEAIVTGQLEHPNIVPVYSLGWSAPDAPFLALKLVEGQSWKELLQAEGGGDLVRHLGILRQVSNAVAYAHSRSIAHNDLKPSNVMLGPFGEVLVVDWGMAVRFDEVRDSRIRNREDIRTPCGTPRYMAPELALGRGSEIGPWTDVFLLGGILYELLTGKPPNDSRSLPDAIEVACTGRRPEPPPALPLELRALCQRALALQPARRPSLEDFQRDLDAFLTHRESLLIAREAERRLGACVERAEGLDGPVDSARRNPLYESFAEALAGFRQARRLWEGNRQAADGELRARLAWARAALGQGDLGLAEAQAAIDGEEAAALRAELAAVRAVRARSQGRVRRLRRALIGATLLLIAGLTAAVVVVAGKNAAIEVEKERVLAKNAEVEAEKRRVEVRNAYIAEQNESIRRQAEELRSARDRLELSRNYAERRGQIARGALDKLTSEVHTWLLDDLNDQRSRRVARQILETARESWEALRDVDVAEALVSQGAARSLRKLGLLSLGPEGDAAQALGYLRKSCAVYAQLSAETPTPTLKSEQALALLGLGEAYQAVGALDSAWLTTQHALGISRGLTAAVPSEEAFRNLCGSLDRIVELCGVRGDLVGARAAMLERLEIERTLYRLDPSSVDARRDLMLATARALEVELELGAVDRAAELGATALELARSLAADTTSRGRERDLSVALVWAFQVAMAQRDLPAARAHLEECLAIWRESLRRDPYGARTRRDYATGLERLGALLSEEGDAAGALAAFRESLVLRRELVAELPESAVARRDLFVGLWTLAGAHTTQGDHTRARDLYTECVGVCRVLVELSPSSQQAERDLVDALNALGTTLEDVSEEAAARDCFEEALRRCRGLVAATPESGSLRRDLFECLANNGRHALAGGQLEAAEQHLYAALDVARALWEAQPESLRAADDYSLALSAVAGLARERGELEEALELYEDCLEIERELVVRSQGDGEARAGLAILLDRCGETRLELGDTEGAGRAFSEALELRRRLLADFPDNLGYLHQVSVGLQNIGMAWLATGDLAAAQAVCEENLRFDREASARHPDNPELLGNLIRSLFYLAHCHKLQLDFDRAEELALEALAAERRLMALNPAVARDVDTLSEALADLRRERTLHAFRSGERAPASTADFELLASGAYHAEDYLACAQAFERAWELGPPSDPEYLLSAADAAARADAAALALRFLQRYLEHLRAQAAGMAEEERAELRARWDYLRDEHPPFRALPEPDLEALFAPRP